jgi:hypothetical protein
MKALFKKKQAKNATSYKSTRAFEMDKRAIEGSVDELVLQRIGKSRQEILDLMKILKTF